MTHYIKNIWVSPIVQLFVYNIASSFYCDIIRKTEKIILLGVGLMFNSLHEECGVFGIFENKTTYVAQSAYLALYALQHRGRKVVVLL